MTPQCESVSLIWSDRLTSEILRYAQDDTLLCVELTGAATFAGGAEGTSARSVSRAELSLSVVLTSEILRYAQDDRVFCWCELVLMLGLVEPGPGAECGVC